MPYDLLLGLAVSLSVLFFWLGRRFAATNVAVDDQLDRFLEDDLEAALRFSTPGSLTRLSFFERVVSPMWRGALGRVGGLAPQRNVDVLTKRLDTAGRPYGLNVLNFLGLKFILALVFAAAGFLLGVAVLQQPLAVGLLLGLALAVIGFYMPNLWLGMVIRARQREIVRALPDALDMIVVCAEAGQSFDQAIKRVGARWHNPLTEEFNRILAEITLGRTRREALSSASDRIQLIEMSNLITAILQADQLGVSIAKVLRVQADQMRIVRRQRAEELARQAAIKMLFPLVFLIFPAMLAVLLGPAIPVLLETLGP